MVQKVKNILSDEPQRTGFGCVPNAKQKIQTAAESVRFAVGRKARRFKRPLKTYFRK